MLHFNVFPYRTYTAQHILGSYHESNINAAYARMGEERGVQGLGGETRGKETTGET